MEMWSFNQKCLNKLTPAAKNEKGAMNKILPPMFALVLWSAQLSAQPVITSQPVNQTAIWGGNATFSVMATDVGPLTYQWQLNGTNLPNNIITTVAGGNCSIIFRRLIPF
jgi:hypothetical protein